MKLHILQNLDEFNYDKKVNKPNILFNQISKTLGVQIIIGLHMSGQI